MLGTGAGVDGGVGATGLLGCVIGMITLLAVTVSPERCPVTAIVVPTPNWLRCAGLFAVPNTVCALSVTVTGEPSTVVTVQRSSSSTLIAPRTLGES